MKKIEMKWIYLIALLLTCSPLPSTAGPGHDHADELEAVTGETSPRVVMQSELFEVVGIAKGRWMEIYVDHHSSNAPVKDAVIELELNGSKVPVEWHAQGEFDAALPEDLGAGPVAVAMTITSGGNMDVMAGELVLDSGHEHGSEEDEHLHAEALLWPVATGLIALAVLVLLALRLKRKGGK